MRCSTRPFQQHENNGRPLQSSKLLLRLEICITTVEARATRRCLGRLCHAMREGAGRAHVGQTTSDVRPAPPLRQRQRQLPRGLTHSFGVGTRDTGGGEQQRHPHPFNSPLPQGEGNKATADTQGRLSYALANEAEYSAVLDDRHGQAEMPVLQVFQEAPVLPIIPTHTQSLGARFTATAIYDTIEAEAGLRRPG